MQTVLYARVSTVEQTIEHQRTQAEAAGFRFDRVLIERGQSGVGTRLADRPEGRRLFDILRAGDVLVVRWLDRLGRNYEDVTATVRELLGRGVTIRTVINGLALDGATADPMQRAVRDALVAFMAATAQAQAEVTREAQAAGIALAKREGRGFRGRKPTYTRAQFAQVQDALGRGDKVAAVAREAGLQRQTVYRIAADPAGAEAALSLWGL